MALCASSVRYVCINIFPTLCCTGVASPQAPCAVLGTTAQKGVKLLESVQRRATRMLKGPRGENLKHLRLLLCIINLLCVLTSDAPLTAYYCSASCFSDNS